MLKFQISGTDSTGKRATLTVQADSAREAHERMTALGYRDITLHTDDAAAAAVVSMPCGEIDEKLVSAADMVELRCLSRWGYFRFLLRKLYGQGRVGLLLAAALVVFSLWQQGSLGVLGWIGAILLVMPLGVATWCSLTGKTHVYEAMLEACYWGRWQEVLNRSAELRGHVPDFELDVRVATALAGLGRLDEGLALAAQHEGADDLPDWMYRARLAEVYQMAGQHDDALQCQREAYEAAPEIPTVMLDYAMGLLKSETETELAASLIRQTEEQPLSDVLQLFLPFARGLLALNTGQFREAVDHFLTCEHSLKPLSAGSAPVRGMVDLIRAFRAIGLARLGERAAAEKLFGVAKPRLEAIKSDRILNRFYRAMTL